MKRRRQEIGTTWSRGTNSRLSFAVNVNPNLSTDCDVLTSILMLSNKKGTHRRHTEAAPLAQVRWQSREGENDGRFHTKAKMK